MSVDDEVFFSSPQGAMMIALVNLLVNKKLLSANDVDYLADSGKDLLLRGAVSEAVAENTVLPYRKLAGFIRDD